MSISLQSVLVRPEDPKLLLPESSLRTVAGQYIQRSCISSHGKPQAKVGWVISDDPNVSSVSVWLGDSKDKFNPTFGMPHLMLENSSH